MTVWVRRLAWGISFGLLVGLPFVQSVGPAAMAAVPASGAGAQAAGPAAGAARAAATSSRLPSDANPRTPHFESVGAGTIPRDVVAALAQDLAGFLWIATGDGLVRYDGYHFRAQERESTDPALRNLGWIRALLPGRDGRLWIGSESQGLALLDPAHGHITLHLGTVSAGAPPMIQSLAEDADGAIWVGSMGDGLLRFDPASGRDTSYRHSSLPGSLPDDRVEALLVDRAGTLWVGTWQGLSRRRPGSDRFEPVGAAGDAGLHGRTVKTLLQAQDGRIWAGTQQGDVAVFDATTGAGRRLPPGGGAAEVTSLVQPGGGPVWVGRATGIDLLDAEQGHLLQHLHHDPAKPEGLAANEVTSLLVDRAGWVWVGGLGLGLQRHNPANHSMWVHGMAPAPGVAARDTDVRSLLQLHNGEIWAATTSTGVVVMDTRLRATDLVPLGAANDPGPPAPNAVVAMAQQADGTVWLGTASTLYQVSRERQLVRKLRHGAGNTNFIHADAKGVLWVGTQDGLYQLPAGAAGLLRVAQTDGRPWGGDIYAAANTGDGGLWVGGVNGLFHIAPGASQAQPVATEAGHGLGNPIVVGMLKDRQGRLWLDTAVAGLHRMLRWDGRVAAFDRVSTRLGAVGRPFGASLLEDSRGRIWSHMHVYDPAQDRLDALTSADGARLGNGRFRVCAKLQDGRMLFGGTRGLLVVSPASFDRPPFAPPLVATELRVNGERRSAGPSLSEVRLSPEDRSFSLEFAALDYTDPMRVRYAFQLRGFDPDWIATDAAHRVAAYSNLPPGRYVLQVRASQREGGWSPQQVSLPVQVLPAWWQTWTFRAALLILAASLPMLLMRLRHRVLQARHDELERVVRQRTASLQEVSTALQEKSAQLEAFSSSDPLTGLRNRRFLTENLDHDVALAMRRLDGAGQGGLARPVDADLIFFVLDIDHFKEVNDRHGHAAGDAVLRQMRGRLQSVFRVSDYLVRWGGEEFLVVARETSRQRAPALAERLRAAVAEQDFVLDDGSHIGRTCSVGFACLPLDPQHAHAVDWHAVLRLADAALYRAKDSGRNAWAGVVAAQGESDAALQAWVRRPLQDWIDTGAVQIETGPGEKP